MDYHEEHLTKKLITVRDNKLVLNNELKEIYQTKVISIIGDARKGKSTFLNCLINFLTDENREYFKVQASLEHCTVGMDYVKMHINGTEYMFIDCQGLNYENSSEDSKYLLFLYSISNIIIFNDMNIINNNIFTTLQPMALFMNHFKQFESLNSLLYIRIADYDLEEDSSKLKDKLFKLQRDQFDNVRKSMLKLFSEIYVCNTLTLDRKEKHELKEGNYLSILSNEENKFRILVENIIQKVCELEPMSINLEELVNSINSNKRIDYRKLDVYTLYTEKEINEFIIEEIYKNPKLDFVSFDDIKQPFNITGFQETREEIIQLEKMLEKIEDKFDISFSKVPANLRDIFKDKVNGIYGFLENMKEKNYQLAMEYNKDKIQNSCLEFWKIISNFNPLEKNPFNCKEILSDIKDSLKPFDIIAVNEILSKIDGVIEEINRLNNLSYQTNKKVIQNLYETLDEIKFDIFEVLDNLTLENCYDGDFKSMLISLNPYKINCDIKFNKISFENSKFNLIEYQDNSFIESIKVKYFSEYMENNLKFKNHFVKKIKELMYGMYFQELPTIKHSEIKYVYLTLLSHPEKPVNVYVETDYLFEILNSLGINERAIDYYLKPLIKDNMMNLVGVNNRVINNWLVQLEMKLFEKDSGLFFKKDIEELIY
jgi:hypothetical protein